MLEKLLLLLFSFPAPFWVTPFIVPVIGRTKVGDPSLVHLTMLKIFGWQKRILQKYQKSNKKTNKLDKRYFTGQTCIKLYNWF